MNSLFRQAWGRLACLVILAAITMALVACGAGPGATKTQDPVGFKNIELRQGSTSEISLVNTFSGSELTYSAKSSAPSKVKVVTVDNDKDTLTVEAVSPGMAIITVTAKNSQGSHDQRFTVIVPEPEPEDDGTGGEEEGAPTVRAGAPSSFEVDQGDTQTVTLSRVFTGEDLEFTVASNDTDVATASEDAGILTITARSPGDATVTVTATNDDGNAAHRITVTVPSPVTATPEPETPTTNNPSSCQSPLTIELNRIAKCKVPSRATLEPPPGGGVTVIRSPDDDEPDVWIIRAHSKGTYTVTIRSGGATPAKTGAITVVVPNSEPSRNTEEDPTIPIPQTDGALISVDLSSASLDKYFDDADDTATDPDTRRYSIGKKPESILINAEDGFAVTGTGDTKFSDGSTLTFDILKKIKESFEVAIYAHDDSDKSQLPVLLQFTIGSDLVPRKRQYPVTQISTTGNLSSNTLNVGPRIGVEHTLRFDSDSTSKGFYFAELRVAYWKDRELLTDGINDDIYIAAPLYYKVGSEYFDSDDNPEGRVSPHEAWKKAATAPDLGDDLYILSSSGKVKATWHDTDNLGTAPQINIELTGEGTGTITIEYYAWVGPMSDDATKGSKPDKAKLSFNVHVISCSSPPDPIDKCAPGVDP